MNEQTVALFEKKQVRRIWHKEEWWFSIIDVVSILTDSPNSRRYWSDLKRDLATEGYTELYAKSVQLKLKAPDGKMRETDCANTEIMLRIIQSIPSPKAEPFKRWLAKIGQERINEINNPELAMERMRLLYEKKGYPKEWIEKRVRGIAVRQDLTKEWDNRGVKNSIEYSILTNEIMTGTFAMDVIDM